MTKKLFARALCFLLGGMLFVAFLVFLPAGTLDYPNGWLLLGVVFLPMLPVGVILMIKNPQLLEKRLSAKEKLDEQQRVIRLSALMFLFGFIIAGLDFRFRLTSLPEFVPPLAAGFYLLGYVLYAEVLRENAYLSRTIEVQDGQRVVSTGLYGVVRHPMYAATLILFLCMPLMLGSALSFLCFTAYPAIIVKRIQNEEALLVRELEGYKAYRRKVKYRLIPFIW